MVVTVILRLDCIDAIAQNSLRYPTLDPHQTRIAIASQFHKQTTEHNRFSQAAGNSTVPANEVHCSHPDRPRCEAQPCTHCTVPQASCHPFRIPGLHGQPYCRKDLGGCQCGSPWCTYQMHFNPYWSYPTRPWRDQYATPIFAPPNRTDWWDVFNKIGEARLISYERTDNGYSGYAADPYGCLGASCFK